ncbi:MAG: dihydrolipoamide acetyltransferase family protein [Cellulomonas sp.]
MPEVVMPRLSDTMEEGTLSLWLKNVGDVVHKGDVLAEVETDKATMDLESFEDGVLERQLVPAGTSVPIGGPVAVIGDASALTESAPGKTVGAAPPPASQTPASGATAAQPHAPVPGVAPPVEPGARAVRESAPMPRAELRTSPLARKLARDHHLDLARIDGSGPQGRITRADVDDAIAQNEAAGPVTDGTGEGPARRPATATAPPPSGEADEVVPLSTIRRVIARRLSESQAVPHFFLTARVNVTSLVAFRTEINAGLAEIGTKISINDLIVRACAVALRTHPEVNASWGEDALLLHRHVNIGVAVSTPAGLIVPVVVDADRKTLSTISSETRDLAERARVGRLTANEMTGGTFTVSNLGMFGIDQFTAVINPPEAAILAVGAATEVPAVRDGLLVGVPMLKVTLTVDHRVLDGATAAAFLRDLTTVLEEPLRIVV